MKIQSKFFLISSAVALSASPLAFADDPVLSICPLAPAPPELVVPVVIVDPVVTEPEVVDVKVDSATKDGEKTETEVTGGGRAGEGEVTDGGDTDTEVTVTGEEVPTTTEDGGVPLDWVKRGGGDNPEIFYDMAGGGTPAVEKADTSNPLSHELDQDDRATAIEAKGNAVSPQIKGEKRETQALVKKGRVFLR